MAEASPLSAIEPRILKALVRHRVPFMIVRLSAGALQDAPVVTEGVELWVDELIDPRFAAALQAAGAACVPPFRLKPPMLGGPGSDPFDLVVSMSGLGTFRDELKFAVAIQVGDVRVTVLSLERILASKTAAGRTKDKLVIPVLEDVIRTLAVRRNAPTKLPQQRRRGLSSKKRK